MAIFTFYRCKLTKRVQEMGLLFPEMEENGTIPIDQIFEHFFPTNKKEKLVVPKIKKDVHDKEEYCYEVLKNEDGILLMTIENNKIKKTIVEKTEIPNPHHPFSHVVIDLRSNPYLVAIEKNSAFDLKPDKLCEILSISLNSLFKKEDVQCDWFSFKKTDVDFWESITTIRQKQHDRVKKISLSFNNDHTPLKTDNNKWVTLLTDISKKAQADGMMELVSQGEGEMNIDALHEDLCNIANICRNEGVYDLTVQFKNFGLFRYGMDVSALYGVDDNVIKEFVDGADDMDLFGEPHLTLDRWLYNMRDAMIYYDEEVFIPGPTKQGNRI